MFSLPTFRNLAFCRSYAHYGDFEPVLDFDVAVGQTSITLHNNNLSKGTLRNLSIS